MTPVAYGRISVCVATNEGLITLSIAEAAAMLVPVREDQLGVPRAGASSSHRLSWSPLDDRAEPFYPWQMAVGLDDVSRKRKPFLASRVG